MGEAENRGANQLFSCNLNNGTSLIVNCPGKIKFSLEPTKILFFFKGGVNWLRWGRGQRKFSS